MIFFNDEAEASIENDFTRSPEELLTAALAFDTDGDKSFQCALERAQMLMTSHWSTERTPVVIFLSDVDYDVPVDDNTMDLLCRSAAEQGRPLSFHAVCFGKETSFHSLRRWAQIALDIQTDGVKCPLSPATVPSSYTEAPDSVRLTETLLGIAESLRKPHI